MRGTAGGPCARAREHRLVVVSQRFAALHRLAGTGMAEVTADEADVADFRTGIDDLAGLLAGSLGLPELLTRMAAST